ncbi:CBS domain-containing protein [Bacillus shivajii]|uniref:CBS domain-containing protein n=1 Tax=Bacillus shivajii TaxID=1983719 RepID=UPI001CFA3145|nr:CBS domain-containing protein [Bacillus shivajii]UCZ52901.1 CBS domain-containing protein [Bacillus shivajii]
MLKPTNQEHLLAERFEVAFNIIDERIKKIVSHYDRRFTALVREGAKTHHLIRFYKEDLEQYAKLRNAIVHDKKEIGYYIADPHIDIVKHIEDIAQIFTSPNYALTIATKNVVYYNVEDSLLELIQGVKEHAFSQYPIYKGKDCIGILKTGDIAKWMAKHVVNSIVDLADIKVMDIMINVNQHPLAFASKSINIFEVENIYKEYHKQSKDLEAVIITENGKEDESPLGFITAWDIIEIDYTVQ